MKRKKCKEMKEIEKGVKTTKERNNKRRTYVSHMWKKTKQSKAEQKLRKGKQSKAKQSNANQSKAKQSKANQANAKNTETNKQCKTRQSKPKQSNVTQRNAKQTQDIVTYDTLHATLHVPKHRYHCMWHIQARSTIAVASKNRRLKHCHHYMWHIRRLNRWMTHTVVKRNAKKHRPMHLALPQELAFGSKKIS